jgi:hypothetical protein
MTLKELYAKRATAWEEAKHFLDTHTMQNGCLSGEDSEQYERMEKEINELTASIKRMERIEDLGRQMDQPVGSPLLGRPGAPEEKKGRASSKYEQAFITALRSNFKKVSDVLEEGTDGNGGYLVPEEWDARLIEALEGGKLEEAWGCGTAAVVSPIGQLSYGDKNYTVNNFNIGETTQYLYDTLTSIQWGKIEDPYGWTVKI